MKKFILGMAAILFYSLNLGACVSLVDRQMTTEDLQLQVLGEVTESFVSFHLLHIDIPPITKNTAYNHLLDAAKIRYAAQYGADVLDVKNITINGEPDVTFLIALVVWPVSLLCDWRDITARGTVVLNPDKLKTGIGSNAAKSAPRDNTAITKSFDTLSRLIPNRSKIAILNILPNNDVSLYISEELTIKFVNSQKYIIVDRDTLATIRQEQAFQMTGEVSDDSAVSIGQFLGANVVITGSITGNGSQRRLRLRALDVKTAQVLAMSSESI